MSGPGKPDPVGDALALRAKAIAAPHGSITRVRAWQRFMDAVFALTTAQQNEWALRVIASIGQPPRATAEAMDTSFTGPANDNARPL